MKLSKQLESFMLTVPEWQERVNEKGEVVTKPTCNKDVYRCHFEKQEAWCDCTAYEAATVVIKLPTLLEFCIELVKTNMGAWSKEVLLGEYTYFLITKLTLGMLIPTNEEGEVLYPVIKPINKPKGMIGLNQSEVDHGNDYKAYQKAQQRVVFYGWKFPTNFVGGVTQLTDGKQVLEFGNKHQYSDINQALNNGVELRYKID